MPVSRNRKKTKRHRSKARSKARDAGFLRAPAFKLIDHDLACGDSWSRGLQCRHGELPRGL